MQEVRRLEQIQLSTRQDAPTLLDHKRLTSWLLKILTRLVKKFTGEPKSSVTLDNLRSTYAAWEATHKLQSGYERLTTTDKFHVIMSKTGGAAHDTCLSLLTEKEAELATHNESLQSNYLREKTIAEQLISAWDAKTPEERGSMARPTLPPQPPIVSTFLGDPVAELWARLLQAYPKDSAVKIQAYGDFKVEDNESITTASQRMSKLALDLKQPQTQATEKLLNALPWEIRGKLRTKLQFQHEDISTWTVELIRSEAEKLLLLLKRIINQEKLLAPKVISSTSSTNNPSSRSDTRTRRNPKPTNKPVHWRANKSTAKAAQNIPASFSPGPCYRCGTLGDRAVDCPDKPVTKGPIDVKIHGKPWCAHHQLNTHDSSQCVQLHPELASKSQNTRSSAAAHRRRINPRGPRGTNNNHKKELFKEYEQRHQTTSAYASRSSSPASSVDISSENPLPAHLKRERKFEFDMDKTENTLNHKAQAKAARRDRVRRNSPKPSTTKITRKRERKQIKKTYSRKRTETQFLRRNPNMPLTYRTEEEMEKFRSNARGGILAKLIIRRNRKRFAR